MTTSLSCASWLVTVLSLQPLPFVNYHVHVWGLDTYCSYASDGAPTPSCVAIYTLQLIGIRGIQSFEIGSCCHQTVLSFYFIFAYLEYNTPMVWQAFWLYSCS
jgi:hypothetical protein